MSETHRHLSPVVLPDILSRLDPAVAAHALGRLREMLAAHLSGDGVWFDSRAWIAAARRR